MDSETKKSNPKGYRPPSFAEANWLSRLVLWYLSPLLRRGYRQRLEEEDLPDNFPSHDSKFLSDALEKEWQKELSQKKQSLFMALVRSSKVAVGIATLLVLLLENVKLVFPILVTKLVEYFQGDTEDLTMMYVYASVLVALNFLVSVPQSHAFHLTMMEGMKARAAVSALVCRKMMNLSAKSTSKTSSGNIVNLLSTDVEQINAMFQLCSYTLASPIQVVIINVLLFREFGIPYLAGMSSVILFALLLFALARGIGRLRLKTASWGDKRTHLMNEIIAGMKVIKMYCWEQPFRKIIADLRKTEMQYTLKAGIMDAQLLNTINTCSKIIAFFTVVTYVPLGNQLSVQQVFKLLAWLENMRFVLFTIFGTNLRLLAKGYYSCVRVQKFLLLEENKISFQTQKEDVLCTSNGYDKNMCRRRSSQCTKGHLKLDDVAATWATGLLVACVGPVGCGKTSLLLSILNQMPVHGGCIIKEGTVAYVPQENWIFSGTVRENILFGMPMQKEQYERVVKLCSLTEDIKRMPNGDNTLVGERGLSLSGGQKARINFARAMFRGGDIYLLDDPLSAVDIQVGQELFHKYLRN